MGFWEQFPYTNYHDLNLTEIIKFVNETIKELARMNKSIDEIRNYIDGLDLPAEVRREVDRIMNQVLTDSTIRAYIIDSQKWSNRKILWVTDSYGDGWDGTQTIANPYTRASNILQCAFTKLSHGGDRFGDSNTSEEYTFLNQIKNYVNSHSDMSSYTDVIISGGANDICFNPSADLTTPITDTCNYIKAHFENAKITLAMVGRLFNTGANNCSSTNFKKIYNQYVQGARANHVSYLFGSELINHDYRKLASDGIHLTNYNEMGDRLASLLRDGNFIRRVDNSGVVSYTPYVGVDNNGIAPTSISFISANHVGTTVLLDIGNITFDYSDNPISAVTWNHIYKICKLSGDSQIRNVFAAGVQSFKRNVVFACTYVGTDNNEYSDNFPGTLYLYDGWLYFSIEGFVPHGTNGITIPNCKYLRLATGAQFRMDEADC